MVQSTIFQIKSLRSNINLCNYTSINNTKDQILSIRDDYSKKFNQLPSEYRISQRITKMYNLTMKAFGPLLQSLYHYQSQIGKKSRKKRSKWTSTSSSIGKRKKFGHRNSFRSNKKKSNHRRFHDNDNKTRSAMSSSTNENQTHRRKTYRRKSRRSK